jgi:titin
MGASLPMIALPVALAAPNCSGSVAAGATYTCSPSGSGPVQVTVPAGVASITVVADGGGGGKNASLGNGGSGARVAASISVTPGEVLTVYVGSGGGAGLGGGGNVGGTGYGAGGNGGPYYGEGFGGGYGGGGGGSSAVLVGGDDTVVAGGGGGGAYLYGGSAGAAAGADGGSGGVAGTGSVCAVGGGGGNINGLGAGGSRSGSGVTSASTSGYAGAGGSGTYGAGGASSGGGGGGGGYGGGGPGNWNGPYGCVNAGGGGAGGSYGPVGATFGSAGNAGGVSPQSAAGGDGQVMIAFVAAPATVPGAPTDLIFSDVSTTGMTLYWTPPASDGGSVLLNYSVSTDDSTTQMHLRDDTVTSPVFSLTGLTPGHTYNFSIRAINAVGASTSALAGSQMTVAPGTPTGPATNLVFSGVTSTSITATWIAPTPVTGWPTLGYQVRVNGGPLTWSPTTSYVVAGLTPATTYTFDVYVVNGAGSSAAVTASLPTYPEVPGAPTNLLFSGVDDTSITATWTAPVSNGGAAITNYWVTVDGGASVSVPSTTYTATGLAPSTWHSFSITAFNSQGSSLPLTGSRSTTAPPNSPMITATATTVGSSSTVTLTNYPASTDETVVVTAPDGSASTLSVAVNGSGSGSVAYTPAQVGTYSLVTDPTARSTTFAATAAPGPGPGPGPAPVPPSAPTFLTAEPGDASATLTWRIPDDPGSSGVTSYEVTSSPAGGVCTTQAPTLTCNVIGLTNGTAYTFTARARNASGWGPWSSGSNVVTPTAPPAPPVPSITITGSRGVGAESHRVYVDGTAMHLASPQVQAWVRLAGRRSYRQGITVPVGSDSRFTWKRTTGKKTYVYFMSGDVRSNRVVIPAA